MTLLLIILIIVLLGGGGYGYSAGWLGQGYGGPGIVGILVLFLVLYLLFGGSR